MWLSRRAQHRLLPAAVAVWLLLVVAVPAGQRPAPTGFASQVAQLSEPGGYFDADNLISNERPYLQVMSSLAKVRMARGAYIGVGPDQNFSYIAQVRHRCLPHRHPSRRPRRCGPRCHRGDGQEGREAEGLRERRLRQGPDEQGGHGPLPVHQGRQGPERLLRRMRGRLAALPDEGQALRRQGRDRGQARHDPPEGRQPPGHLWRPPGLLLRARSPRLHLLPGRVRVRWHLVAGGPAGQAVR